MVGGSTGGTSALGVALGDGAADARMAFRPGSFAGRGGSVVMGCAGAVARSTELVGVVTGSGVAAIRARRASRSASSAQVRSAVFKGLVLGAQRSVGVGQRLVRGLQCCVGGLQLLVGGLQRCVDR